MNAVKTLQDTIAGAAESVGPSVVGLGRGWGHGSGVVIADGQVLTSAHNLRREEVTVSFHDGRRERAELVGSDPDLDLAVLAVDTGDAPAVRWEPAEAPGIGAPVVALANPGGRGLRATLGFVSSGERSFRGPRGRRVHGAIEHTAPLPRGSSGGPLVDPDGNLLGLNSLRLDGGLILAVPASAAVKERALLLARGEAPAAAQARRGDRASARGAAPAPRGRAAGARRPARAGGRGRQPRGGRGTRAGRPDRRSRRRAGGRRGVALHGARLGGRRGR